MIWQKIGDVDLERTAREVLDVIGDRAVISSVALFANPLQDANAAADWGAGDRRREAVQHRPRVRVAGAIEQKPITESMPAYKQVWGELAKRAEGNGVRVAFENCDMVVGGTRRRGTSPTAHRVGDDVRRRPVAGDRARMGAVSSNGEPESTRSRSCAVGRDGEDLPRPRQGRDDRVGRRPHERNSRRKTVCLAPHARFGDTNWTDVISILRMNGYKGSIDIEGWHDPVYARDLEMTGQVRGLNYLKQCRGGPYVPNPKVENTGTQRLDVAAGLIAR
jgi:sugar phosphate isomerase/epimerase